MIPQRARRAVVLAFVLIAPSLGKALAQTADGPRVIPAFAGTPSAPVAPKKAHPPKPSKAILAARAKAIEKAKAPVLEPWAAVDPDRVAPLTPPDKAPPPPPPAEQKGAAASVVERLNTPPDLAMKWNGNNDTVTQTRATNYGGDAEGAGAQVGMKFHF